MSVTLVHTGVSHTRTEYCIWEALNQTWPRSSTIARFGTSFSTDRSIEVNQADVIISTSLEAATTVQANENQLHMCYLEPLSSNPKPINHQLVNSLTDVEFVVPTRTLQNLNRDRFTSFVNIPVDTHFFSSNYEKRDTFYLLIVDGEWSKEDQLAVDACRELKQSLSIIGIAADQLPENLHHDPFIEIIGPVDDQTLREQYRLCSAVICPRDVDFDLSAIEAQSCGTPVVIYASCEAANSVVCFEQHGLGSGIYFDEQTVDALVSAILELKMRPQRCQAVIGWCSAAQYSHQQFQIAFNKAITKEIAYRIKTANLKTASQDQQDEGPSEQRSAA